MATLQFIENVQACGATHCLVSYKIQFLNVNSPFKHAFVTLLSHMVCAAQHGSTAEQNTLELDNLLQSVKQHLPAMGNKFTFCDGRQIIAVRDRNVFPWTSLSSVQVFEDECDILL